MGALRYRVVEVTAPAGFGKSFVLDYLSSSAGLRIGRIRVAKAPALALMRALCEGIGDIAPTLFEMAPVAFENALRDDNILGLVPWFCSHLDERIDRIAIDDLHLLGDDHVSWSLLAELIAATRSLGVGWVLASRGNLMLPTLQWIASGDQALPIQALDLTMQLDEIQVVATQMGYEISGKDALAIGAMGHGWPIVTAYLIRSWERASNSNALALEARDRGIEAIAHSLFSTLSPEDTSLLFAIALLDASTVDELERLGYDNVAEGLRRLVVSGMPMVCGSDAQYRAHELLRDYLFTFQKIGIRREAASLTETLINLQKPSRALGLALSTASADLVRTILSASPRYFLDADGDLVGRALMLLPRIDLETKAVPALIAACQKAKRGEWADAERCFQRALPLCDSALRPLALVRFAQFLYNYGGDARKGLDVFALAALEELPTNLAERCEVLCFLAFAAAAADHIATADELLHDAIELVDVVDDPVVRSGVYQRAAYVAWRDNRFKDAEEMALRALDIADVSHSYGIASACYHMLYIVAPNARAALGFAEKWKSCARKVMDRQNSHLAAAAQFELCVRVGEIDRARLLWREVNPVPKAMASWTGFHIRTGQALLLMMSGQFEDAFNSLRLMRDLGGANAYGETHNASNRIEHVAYCSMAAFLVGDHVKAAKSARAVVVEVIPLLRQKTLSITTSALELSLVCAGVVCGVLGQRDIMLSALTYVSSNGTSEARRDCARWAEQAIHGQSIGLGEASDELSGYVRIFEKILSTIPERPRLTGAEVRVLQLLARGRTTKEIAAAFSRSPKTIENQISSVLRKVNAGNRREAIVAAQRMGLLKSDASAREERG